MGAFEIKQRAAAGRIGILHTPHGRVTTPTLLPVVNPNLKLIAPREMRRLFGAEMVITNSYVLRQTPALRDRALAEGVHQVLDWDGPVMTDSGTFQSYRYGSVDVRPDEIIEFQKRIGVDVGTILDVFTTPERTRSEAASELEETLQRARRAQDAKGPMLLAATVQGGVHADLREKAARAVAELGADVAPIGGVVPLMEQGRYEALVRVILAAKRNLPSGMPVHLFGAGHPLVFPLAVALGCDLFDSASYAKFAKDDRMMFPWGTRAVAELDELPCACPACDRHRTGKALRALAAPERERALAEHNLHVSFAEIRRIRQAIRDGNLWELVEERATQNPALLDALRPLREPGAVEFAERLEPVSGARAFAYRGPHTFHRPLVHRFHGRLLARYRVHGAACFVLPARSTPYGDAYAGRLDAFRKEGATQVVDTPLGPVPLELDLFYPVAQSVFPQDLDSESIEVRRRFSQAFFARFAGCDVLPYDFRAAGPGASAPSVAARDWFDERRVRATAEMQFGADAANGLFRGDLEFVRSPNNDRVRNVRGDGKHLASLRAEDGLLSLRWAGAERILKAVEFPRLRLVVDEDAGAFVREGKNVMAKTVQSADADLRPGDDALIVTPDDGLVGVGRLVLSGPDVRGASRGVAARTVERPVEE